MTVSGPCFVGPRIRQECKFTGTLNEGVGKDFSVDKSKKTNL